jgi:hypothetical protein
MTIKKAKRLIKSLTKEVIKTSNEDKITKIERKINILKDFILFQKDLKA